ncbi:hypothetical protein C8Q76DRAFT_452005 [Earliella scabrosa]|nr:hypothetical protein C8Q76DRAFT_452005 [Earliella scabrosa]
MLLRTARHGIPPAITLDFLVPVTLLHRRIPHGPPITNKQETSTSCPATRHQHASFATQAMTQPSSSSSALTPATVLAQLETVHPSIKSQTPANLTNAQVEAFNKILPELRQAFHVHDMARATELWSFLKEGKLLAFFGPLQYDICSRLVMTYCKHVARGAPFTQEVRDTLEEMALVMAAEGATDGLRYLMLLFVKSMQPRESLALYDLYLQILRDRGLLRQLESEEDESTPSFSPIRDEVLFAAVVAYAQLDAFAEALPAYLAAKTRIAPTTIQESLQFVPRDLHQKVKDYANRLDTASLISRPESLTKHLTNLTKDAAHHSLERLYTTTISGVRGQNPWLAVKPSDLGGTRTVLLPGFFWTMFLRSFLQCRLTDLSERLWDDMLSLGVVPQLATWNALLDGYARNRAVDPLLATWNLMVSEGIRPDALSHRALIHGLYYSGMYDEGQKRFDTFKQAFVKPGAPTADSAVLSVYNTVIYDLLFAARYEPALTLMEDMEANGPKPDIITYNTFLRYHARRGDLKAMSQVLQKLQPRGIMPDVYTYSTLLSAMLKVRPDADRMMIAFMKRNGVSPDTTSLTAIIDNQLRENTPESFDVAMNLLSKMERNEYEDAEPNAVTYTAVLTALHRGKWPSRTMVEEQSRRLWERMRQRGITPSRATYNAMIKSSLQNPELVGLENAMAYYRDMLKARVHIGNDTWYILLRGLMDKEEWEMADEVAKDMTKLTSNALPRSLRTLATTISRHLDT